jgi:Arc/MetJ-type ribon-helix-helix transcriptional regulator
MYMKQILLEIDDRCARDLERVAPAGKRIRAEFIRLALRRAIDLALDRKTEQAYLEAPLAAGLQPEDIRGWDEQNLLARRGGSPRARRAATKRRTK